MRRNHSLILVLFFCGLGILLSQEKVDEYLDFWDGYDWEEFSRDPERGPFMKVGYITGFVQGRKNGMWYLYGKLILPDGEEALSMSAHVQENKKILAHMLNLILADDLLAGVSYGQIIEGIDYFYKDYANKKIPVFHLAQLTCKRVKGQISQPDIEKELIKLRQTFSGKNR